MPGVATDLGSRDVPRDDATLLKRAAQRCQRPCAANPERQAALFLAASHRMMSIGSGVGNKGRSGVRRAATGHPRFCSQADAPLTSCTNQHVPVPTGLFRRRAAVPKPRRALGSVPFTDA